MIRSCPQTLNLWNHTTHWKSDANVLPRPTCEMLWNSLLSLTKRTVQGSSIALAVQGEQALSFMFKFPCWPWLKKQSTLKLFLVVFMSWSIFNDFISMNFEFCKISFFSQWHVYNCITFTSFLSLVEVASLIDHCRAWTLFSWKWNKRNLFCQDKSFFGGGG